MNTTTVTVRRFAVTVSLARAARATATSPAEDAAFTVRSVRFAGREVSARLTDRAWEALEAEVVAALVAQVSA